MSYFKLGCNWGSGKPDFYEMLQKHSIVICAEQDMIRGDYVAITQGHTVIALALLIGDKVPCTSVPKLQEDFQKYQIDYKDWNLVAKAQIWLLPENKRFRYQLQQGICMIKNSDIQEKIHSLISIIMGEKIINDCTKLLLGNSNIILTGAPGTGKTYIAKQIAKAMGAKWKLVQFHPSYDYTDFVEGLRPINKGQELGFQRKNGVFKEFCKNAIISFKDIEREFHTLEDRVRKKEIINLETFSGGKSKTIYSIKDGIFYFDRSGEPKTDISASLSTLKKLYDQGINCLSKLREAGTVRGKLSDIGGNTSGIWAVYNYILCRLKYVFIIDEINRGEISKIFGELFYSIDPGYRGEDGTVETQYQNLIPKEGDEDFDTAKADIFRNGFYIPENVYIIGTMNDIDRSVESMDFAMRRRFAWKEITTEDRQSMLDDAEAWGKLGKPKQGVIDNIKARMNALNAAIIDKYENIEDLSPRDKIGLSKAYQIGASYFLKYNKYDDFDDLWEYHLVGLLFEYLRGTNNVDAKIDRLHNAYNLK